MTYEILYRLSRLDLDNAKTRLSKTLTYGPTPEKERQTTYLARCTLHLLRKIYQMQCSRQDWDPSLMVVMWETQGGRLFGDFPEYVVLTRPLKKDFSPPLSLDDRKPSKRYRFGGCCSLLTLTRTTSVTHTWVFSKEEIVSAMSLSQSYCLS